MMPIVDVQHVWKRYGSNIVLRGVSLRVEPGEVVCLLGPSGSGKSTILRCLNNLERIDAGSIRVNDELVGVVEHQSQLRLMTDAQASRQRRDVGMVFQNFNLFPHMTAIENVALGPIQVLGIPKSKAREDAAKSLTQVGLAGREAIYPRQLSGGQQQRVAIARALAMHPKLLLFDEPTSALDPELVGEVLTVMRNLAQTGMTMLVVTHEIGFARDVADRVVFIDHGVVVEEGPPGEVLDHPATQRARQFLAQVRTETKES
jgi:polar amino acid transport system ATP-binding protein